MGRLLASTLVACLLLIAAPHLVERSLEAGAVPPAPPRSARPAPDLAGRLHVGMPVLTVLAGLRERAAAGQIEIASAAVEPVQPPRAGEPLAERTIRLTAKGGPGELLRYAESVALAAMPVRVESVELCEVSTARIPLLRLELRVLVAERTSDGVAR